MGTTIFQGVASKATTFIETTWKMSSTNLTFHCSVTSSSARKLDLKIRKMFQKSSFSGAPRPPK